MNWTPTAIMIVPLAVPVFVAFLKSFIPTLDKRWLPLICPALGVLADQLVVASGLAGVGPQWALFLGLAGNGVREVYDQWTGNAAKKKEEPPK